jgi:penicillin-binding protein 1A
VVDAGTGTGVRRYTKRQDVAGKTGTTNDSIDGWFAGYAGEIVTVAWMGFDDNRPLGKREFGATTALPIWAAYMEGRLAGVPVSLFEAPSGVARINGDWAYTEYPDGVHAVASIGFPPPAPAEAPLDGATPANDGFGPAAVRDGNGGAATPALGMPATNAAPRGPGQL